MREIRFRAWDVATQSMYFTDKDHTVWCGGKECSVNSDKGQVSGNYIPMQYTGLKDKNGKEIYEGDIVFDGLGNPRVCKIGEYKIKKFMNGDLSDSRTHYGVHFHAEAYTTETKISTPINWPSVTTVLNEFDAIIGNIHENPELLKS